MDRVEKSPDETRPMHGEHGSTRRMPEPGVGSVLENERSPEQVRRVWAERAAKLAEVPPQDTGGETSWVAPLRLGRELYAIPVEHVTDIRPLEMLTRVPRAPEWFAGVTNLRGHIYPVIDLQRFLGVAAESRHKGDRAAASPGTEEGRFLVVVEAPEMELALLVDEVLPLCDVQLDRIQEVGGQVRVVSREVVRGVADTEAGGAMVILDLSMLLADKRLIVHEDLE